VKAAAKVRQVEKARGAVYAARRRGAVVILQAGAERSWSLCAPLAAKPESVGMAMAVITAMTVITAAAH